MFIFKRIEPKTTFTFKPGVYYLPMSTAGLKFRAYADEATVRAIRARLDAACALYNTLRSADHQAYKERGRGLGRYELKSLALKLRREHEEYNVLYSMVADEVADRFYRARGRFFKGVARFPRPKKPEKYHSITYRRNGWKIISARLVRGGKKRMVRLRLSNLGELDVLVHRDFPMDRVRRVTVKIDRAGRIFVIFVVDGFNPYHLLPRTGREAGLDVGIEKLIVTSDGYYVPNPRLHERELIHLDRLREEFFHKKRGSKRWEKARLRLARAEARIADTRRDMYMKVGKALATHYDLVVMEDINIRRMAGRSRRVLRWRLHDASFHELRSIIEYQMKKYGKEFALVDPNGTSKTCARCGFVNERLTLNNRVFVCPVCYWVDDRDHNAALNILKKSGREPPVVPAELHPLPLPLGAEWWSR